MRHRHAVRPTPQPVLRLLLCLLFLVAGCADQPAEQPAGSEAETAHDEQSATPPEGATVPPPDPYCEGTVHFLTINRHGAQCQVTDENGNTVIQVRQGDWVVWTNAAGNDMKLNFGGDRRLFGVSGATVYGEGEPLRLKVRGDAEVLPGNAPHGYIIAGCGASEPPPGIIVCPPGGCT